MSYGVVKMNVDTDLQWALWEGIRTTTSRTKVTCKAKSATPKGPDEPNKKYYDPRSWLRAGEESFKARLRRCFEELNNVNP